jgi:hypothetical protein
MDDIPLDTKTNEIGRHVSLPEDERGQDPHHQYANMQEDNATSRMTKPSRRISKFRSRDIKGDRAMPRFSGDLPKYPSL